MLTRRTISNISYNSREHFEHVVQSLRSRGIIDWCYWIYHVADTDETKDHIHFVLAPSTRIDTSALRKQFDEIDPSGNGLFLSCTSKWFFTNSLDDWLLYAVHDPSYLTSKGQLRNHLYSYDDLHSTDPDALRHDWNMIDRLKYKRLEFLYDAVKQEVPFAVLVQQGVVPIAQRSQYEYQYNSLAQLFKSGAAGRFLSHEQVDEDGVLSE